MIARPTDPPLFVERGGAQEGTPPVIMNGARVAAFILPASRDSLDAVLDRYINTPSAGRFLYRSLSPNVLMYFADFARTFSGDFDDRDLGEFNELEVGFWQVAIDVYSGHIAWFPSYVFTSVDVAVTEGREVYGWPKQWGKISFPAWDQITTDGLQLQVKRFKNFGLGATEEFGDVVNVRCATPTPHHIDTRFHSVDDAVRSIVGALDPSAPDIAVSPPSPRLAFAPPTLGTGRVPGIGRPRRPSTPSLRPVDVGERQVASVLSDIEGQFFDLAAALLAQRTNLLFLKQVRDAQFPHLAVYQAIVEAEAIVDTVRDGGILSNDWMVELEPGGSEPIRHELGLANGQLKPTVAFCVDFDVRFDDGRTLWRAPELR